MIEKLLIFGILLYKYPIHVLMIMMTLILIIFGNVYKKQHVVETLVLYAIELVRILKITNKATELLGINWLLNVCKINMIIDKVDSWIIVLIQRCVVYVTMRKQQQETTIKQSKIIMENNILNDIDSVDLSEDE